MFDTLIELEHILAPIFLAAGWLLRLEGRSRENQREVERLEKRVERLEDKDGR